MAVQYTGLAVVPTHPASMEVTVQPGALVAPDRTIEVKEAVNLKIREGGQRRFEKQVYVIRGEGTSSPSWWNGEDIRGSGGTPYQRMVPNSLSVYSKDRETLYEPDTDYTYDFFWGTVKRNPNGRIAPGEELSLDYSVWLCRYDAIVLLPSGVISVVEGDSEAPESRELLLPEPPVVKEGFVLAHVFTGWGQSHVYGGNSSVSSLSANAPGIRLLGRYEDMERRTYHIEIAPNAAGGHPTVRFGATGEDYGLGHVFTEANMRWTNPIPLEFGTEIPLTLNAVYGFEVDWGLGIEIEQPSEAISGPIRYTVDAIPEMILDMRPALNGADPLELIPLERSDHLAGIRQDMRTGKPTRIAFFGESCTRSGLWVYQTMEGLKERYPDTKFRSSNVAVGGEQSMIGVHRLEHEVLSLRPDLILLEYFINDAGSGDPDAVEKSVRTILGRIRQEGIPCLVVMANGVNPLFSRYYSKRNFRRFYELYRNLSAEYNVAFLGGFNYFDNIHRFGKYFVTEFKGNMVNHTFGNEDFHWGAFDRVLSRAIIRALSRD